MNEKILEQIKNVLSSEKYAFYLRKSRKDLELEALGEGETLAKHTAILEELAARHGIHPDQITVYKEIVSGESLRDRPQAQLLLDHVLQGRYKAVFVVEVERLARGNTRDQGEVAEAFQASHTKIITAQRTYDPDSETDEEYFEFGLFMSRREYKTYQRRQKAGKEQSVKDGNYLLPQRVFGYEIIRPSKKIRTLKPIPEEVKIVHMIFDWYTEERKAIGWITRHLTMMGVQTVKHKPEWHRSTVMTMLKNPIYIGKVTWGGSRTVKEYDEQTGRLKKVRRFDFEPEIYEGRHDGIISYEQFEKAQAILTESQNAAIPIAVEMVNPLAGMLVCSKCGRSMLANRFVDKETRIRHVTLKTCKKKSVTLSVLMDAFEEFLRESIANFEIQEAEGDNGEMERYEAKLQSLEAELAKLEKLRTGIFQKYEIGDYTRDEFIERKQYYNSKVEAQKAEIEQTKKNAPKPVDYTAKIITLNSMLNCIGDPELSVKEKNDFLKEFISKIEYDVIDFGHKKGGKPILKVHFK